VFRTINDNIFQLLLIVINLCMPGKSNAPESKLHMWKWFLEVKQVKGLDFVIVSGKDWL